MFQEPLLLIGAYFIFFLLAIIYVRLDFAITKDEGADSKLKAAGICENIISHQVQNHKLEILFIFLTSTLRLDLESLILTR